MKNLFFLSLFFIARKRNFRNPIVGCNVVQIDPTAMLKNAISDSQDEYFESEEALNYSSQKAELAHSPELKMTGLKARKQSWSTNQNVESLLLRMYNNEHSSLYHGFTKQHKSVFTMAVSAVVKGGIRDEDNDSFFWHWKVPI